MKQVIFAIALLAMASLTGCLNTEDSPVDENIDTTDDSTSDTTEDTKDDELIEPVGQTGYTPPEKANITVYDVDGEMNDNWVAKDGHRITTSCINGLHPENDNSFLIFDSEDNLIYAGNSKEDYRAYEQGCGVWFDITLGPEPAKVALGTGEISEYEWFVTF